MKPPAPVTSTRRPASAEGVRGAGAVIVTARASRSSYPHAPGGGYEGPHFVGRGRLDLSVPRIATVPAVEWQVPLADVVIEDEDLAAVMDTYRSGWLSMGPRT